MSDDLAYVLLPGLDGTGDLFGPFVEATHRSSLCRIVRYPRNVVLGRERLGDCVAEAIPTGRYVLIAESYSGLVGLLFAQRAGANLAALVLCNSFVTPPVWPGWRYAPLSVLLRWRPPRFVVSRLLLDKATPNDFVEQMRDAVTSVAPAVLAARVREILQTDAKDELASCPAPVLYLRGNRDRLVPNSAVHQVRRVRPDLTYQELPGPHLLLQCNPAGAALAIDSFVDALGGNNRRG